MSRVEQDGLLAPSPSHAMCKPPTYSNPTFRPLQAVFSYNLVRASRLVLALALAKGGDDQALHLLRVWSNAKSARTLLFESTVDSIVSLKVHQAR